MTAVCTIVAAYTHRKDGQTYQNTAIVCHSVELNGSSSQTVQEIIRDAVSKAYATMPNAYTILSISHTFQIITD